MDASSNPIIRGKSNRKPGSGGGLGPKKLMFEKDMKPKNPKKNHQEELNQLGAIAEQIFDGTTPASKTVTDIVLQEARASYCRLQVENAEAELKKRVRRTAVELRTIQDHLAFHKKELAGAEQKVKDLNSQHKSRN